MKRQIKTAVSLLLITVLLLSGNLIARAEDSDAVIFSAQLLPAVSTDAEYYYESDLMRSLLAAGMTLELAIADDDRGFIDAYTDADDLPAMYVGMRDDSIIIFYFFEDTDELYTVIYLPGPGIGGIGYGIVDYEPETGMLMLLIDGAVDKYEKVDEDMYCLSMSKIADSISDD